MKRREFLARTACGVGAAWLGASADLFGFSPMTDNELAFASIEEIARLFRKRKLSPIELTKFMLDRIERFNSRLNAYITVSADLALVQAKEAEAELFAPRGRKGHRDRGPLQGIPISLKDNIYTNGIRTTAGSKILGDFVPVEDAHIVRKLRDAGAVLLGKTNMHEFAYGVTSNNPHYGPVRNPWDLERIPGGSSGGSAAALAAGLCYASVGTDTGGSIRIPAALCGIVGLKPTYGRVSMHGTVPLAPSLDHVGPLARTVADVALILQAIAGRDPQDAISSTRRVPNYRAEMKKAARRIRLGWPREYFWDRVDEETRGLCRAAVSGWEKRGARVVEVSVPRVVDGDAPSTAIALAEALAYHKASGWYPARSSEYGEDVRMRLEMGSQVSAAEYVHALEFRKELRAEWDAALSSVDAIVAPTVPFMAPRIGEETVKTSYGEDKVRAALLRLNRPSNYTGLPAISVPCGFTGAGAPVGLQLIGRAFEEGGLLRVALAFERVHPQLRRPSL